MSHYGLPPLPLQVPGILSTLQSRCNLLMRIVHFAYISSLRSSCPAVARVRLPLFMNCLEEVFSVGLLEVAEPARLEPLQYQLEGLRRDAGTAREGVFHSPDGEQCKGDNGRQRQHHQPVRPGVPQAEHIREPNRYHATKDQNGPQ